MATSRETEHAKGSGLEARARPRPLVMIISAVAILVVIAAIWIGFAANSRGNANKPEIINPSPPSMTSQPAAPAQSG